MPRCGDRMKKRPVLDLEEPLVPPKRQEEKLGTG